MRAHPGRRGHPPELRARAGQLRREGASRATIARTLDVGFGTVSRWFREDHVPAPAAVVPDGWSQAHLAAVRERWARQDDEQASHAEEVSDLSDRELLLLGTGLYWAEGAKAKPWRRTHRVVFMNSDPSVIAVFLAYLRVLGIPRDRITCSLAIHQSADVESSETYWREHVGAGVTWNRTSLKRHNPASVRYNRGPVYRGCLRIDVLRSAADYRRIAGTWEGVAAAVGVERSPVV